MHLENLLIGHKSLAGNTGISVLLFYAAGGVCVSSVWLGPRHP